MQFFVNEILILKFWANSDFNTSIIIPDDITKIQSHVMLTKTKKVYKLCVQSIYLSILTGDMFFVYEDWGVKFRCYLGRIWDMPQRAEPLIYNRFFLTLPTALPHPRLGVLHFWSIWGLPLNLSVPLCHHIQMIHNWVPWCWLSLPSRIAVRLIFVEIPEDCPVRTEGQKSLIATGIFHPILLPLVLLFSNYVVSVCNSLRSF